MKLNVQRLPLSHGWKKDHIEANLLAEIKTGSRKIGKFILNGATVR